MALRLRCIAATNEPPKKPKKDFSNMGQRVKRRFIKDRRESVQLLKKRLNRDIDSTISFLDDLLDREENRWGVPEDPSEPIEPEILSEEIVEKENDGYEV